MEYIVIVIIRDKKNIEIKNDVICIL